MSAMEDRVKDLETKFNVAATVALYLGVSIAGLGGWVKYEAGKVSDLHDDVKKLEPFVNDAKVQLEKTGQAQLALIQTKADPVVAQLAKQAFDKMADNAVVTGEGVTAGNPWGNKDLKTSEVSCPKGQYLAGITAHWGGTCHGACDEDGGSVHALVPICRKLVP